MALSLGFRPPAGAMAMLAAIVLLAQAGPAPASALKVRGETLAARPPFPAAKPLPPGARPAARGDRPLLTATSTGPGQTGYVHYFIVKLPDESLEIQVGLELPDQRIAWSFPGLGVAVSPFVEEGVVSARGQDYEVWHLYGVRPFPDDDAMAALGRTLANRVNAWAKAGIPYCQSDEGGADCMSCIGFVLRVLFPARAGGYPSLPSALTRSGGTLPRYTPNDLLLYLTGMLDLATREARLQRLSRLTLPDELREDLEDLVMAIRPAEAAGAAPGRPLARKPNIGTRSTLRRPL